MQTAREIAEMVNHGNDVDDFERYIEYFEHAARAAYIEAQVEIDRLRSEVESLKIFKQAVLDPENQPSQFGTVLLKDGKPVSAP